MPITIVISGLLKFFVQLSLLLIGIFIYYFNTDALTIRWEIVFFPLLLLIVIILSLGFGLIVSALTTKYRDLKFLIDFAVPLFKYVTPGIATTYAIFTDKLPKSLTVFVKYNPLGYIIDSFNFMFVGAGSFQVFNLLYSALFALVVLFIGLIIFNQTDKTFMDTV
ncbi:MAG: hypothetical protein R2836_01905 [Chitinophagales bacterium]